VALQRGPSSALLLDTHAIRPPAGAATRSVGNGVAISVSIDSVVCYPDRLAVKANATIGASRVMRDMHGMSVQVMG